MFEHVKRKQLLLGASMYVPGTQPVESLVGVANGRKFPELRSVIFCTEDAVLEQDVPVALDNIAMALRGMEREVERPLRFIRARNPHIFGRLLAMPDIHKVDGFVLPKISAHNFYHYVNQLSAHNVFYIMPTLETREAFDPIHNRDLREMILGESRVSDRVICMRFGGNDLLHLLRVRRPTKGTIYDTVLGSVISQVASQFVPYGIGVSGPVCEGFSDEALENLRREVELDLNNGLFGKTAIHPTQIPVIEAAYKVNRGDLEEAHAILAPGAKAVFKRAGQRMCEPTTHSNWAEDVIDRAQIYGVIEE